MQEKMKYLICLFFYLVSLGLVLSLCYGTWFIAQGAWDSPLPWYSTPILFLFPVSCALASGIFLTGGRILFFGKELFRAQDHR